MSADKPGYTIWIDVEDLFHYAAANPRPSGIQRLAFEIMGRIEARAAIHPARPRIVFVRQPSDGSLLQPVPFAAVAELFSKLAGHESRRGHAQRKNLGSLRSRLGSLASGLNVTPGQLAQRLRHRLIRKLESMPDVIGAPLLEAAVQQVLVLRLLRRLWRNRAAHSTMPAPPPAIDTPRAGPPRADYLSLVRRGDIFLILGAAWVHDDFGSRIAALKARTGILPVLLLYDLIPVRRPEFCHPSLVKSFTHWLNSTLPHCNRLLAISKASARDVDFFAAEQRLGLTSPVLPIPLGTDFGNFASTDTSEPRGLPPAGSYVLFVSTIEARKNHALLFRVWRRLLAELPRHQVPTLVFAGRVGWLVADLMQQIENAEWLGGKIRLIRDPSDEELRHLYLGCQFSVFPSHFEGWGLPVTESLMLGRPVAGSNSTSVPEAGGECARYFNPDSSDDAYRVIHDILTTPGEIERWREQVARDFKPVSWEVTADAVLEACDAARQAGAAS